MHDLSLTTSRGRDRLLLALLGLSACGPVAPATTDDSDGTTTSASATTDPGGSTGVTTGPEPECVENFDCGDCGVCEDGVCGPDYGCCANLTPNGDRGWRCSPPPPDGRCYDDYQCPDDQFCEDGVCVPGWPEPIVLPTCTPQPTAAAQWNLTQAPGALDLADLDGDGDLDLYAALPSGAALELAFNDGAGNFTGGTLIDVGPPLPALHPIAADLDGDLDVDLAVARPNSGDLVLLFGQDGEFTPGPVLSASSAPWTVTAADINFDGNADLVTIGSFLGVSVWFGAGQGQFGEEVFAPDVVESMDATVVDLDGDGVPDILSAPVGASMQALRGDPGGSWKLAREFAVPQTAWSPALVGDLGGVAGQDLAIVANNDPGTALVWANVGVFEWPKFPQPYLSASALLGGRFADVTGEGDVDLVSATGSATVAVLVGDGAGGFACELALDVAADTSRALLATGDVDGDGRTDIVAGVADGSVVTVLHM